MFAVIKTGGKQYKVAEGDILQVEKLSSEEGQKITFDEVLLIGDGEKTFVGTPTLAKAQVQAVVLENLKDDKILVFKKKRRKQYRRTRGHRQELTKVKIEKIFQDASRPAVKEAGKAPEVSKKAKAPAPKKAPKKSLKPAVKKEARKPEEERKAKTKPAAKKSAPKAKDQAKKAGTEQKPQPKAASKKPAVRTKSKAGKAKAEKPRTRPAVKKPSESKAVKKEAKSSKAKE